MATIQELIKASSFNSSGHKAYVNLLYTYFHFYNLHCELLKPWGILPQHYNILRIIKGKHPEPVTPGHIIDVMLDKKRDLTRLVDKLESMGYVQRTQNTQNKRFIHISITELGLEEYAKIEIEGLKLYHNLDEENSEVLSDLLDKMR